MKPTFRLLCLISLVVIAAALTTGPHSVFAADPLTDLAAFVGAGRLDPEILDSLKAKGSADGIVVIDDTAVLAQVASQKAALGISDDSPAILSQKQATFTS